MVSKLTHSFISNIAPLFTKHSSFFIRTNRAVSLFAIFFIKKMPMFAMSLNRVFISNRIRIGHSVFAMRNHTQMSRINTASIFAYMVNNHISRDISYMKIISHSMTPSSFFSKIKSAISVFVQSTLPQMTRVNFYPFSIKSIKFVFCKSFHVIQYTPCKGGCQYA